MAMATPPFGFGQLLSEKEFAKRCAMVHIPLFRVSMSTLDKKLRYKSFKTIYNDESILYELYKRDIRHIFRQLEPR